MEYPHPPQYNPQQQQQQPRPDYRVSFPTPPTAAVSFPAPPTAAGPTPYRAGGILQNEGINNELHYGTCALQWVVYVGICMDLAYATLCCCLLAFIAELNGSILSLIGVPTVLAICVLVTLMITSIYLATQSYEHQHGENSTCPIDVWICVQIIFILANLTQIRIIQDGGAAFSLKISDLVDSYKALALVNFTQALRAVEFFGLIFFFVRVWFIYLMGTFRRTIILKYGSEPQHPQQQGIRFPYPSLPRTSFPPQQQQQRYQQQQPQQYQQQLPQQPMQSQQNQQNQDPNIIGREQNLGSPIISQ